MWNHSISFGPEHILMRFYDKKEFSNTNFLYVIKYICSFYRCEFDTVNGGEMTQLEYHNFLKPEEAFWYLDVYNLFIGYIYNIFFLFDLGYGYHAVNIWV